MEDVGVLIYDGECGFCTNSAKWARNRLPEPHRIAPSQDFDQAALADMGLSRADVDRAAWWYEPGSAAVEGAECISRTLLAIGGKPALIGRLLWLPVMRLLSGFLYRWVAANRPLVGRWAARLSRRSRTAA